MWNILSIIINIILGLLSIYFYFENKKLKGFQIERDISIKKAQIKELELWRKRKKREIDEEMAKRGLTFSGIRNAADKEFVKEYENRKVKLDAQLNYLEKLNKHKWLFSK